MEIFELVKKQKMLPQKLDELVPLSFIGQAAVSFYRGKIKLMDQLNMTEAQRKATLKDGQEAGEMLLDIEVRIGELLPSAKEALKIGQKRGGFISRGKEPKSKSPLGDLKPDQASHARAIHKNPKVVEKVKAQARKNEDIPTKTAVLSEIRYQNEKKRRKEAEAKKTEIKAVISIEQVEYINALERCIRILPQKPPKRWNQQALKEAKAYAKIIIKRLEVFIDGQT